MSEVVQFKSYHPDTQTDTHGWLLIVDH